MTYFGFLAIFLLAPIAFLGCMYFLDKKKDSQPGSHITDKAIRVVFGLVLVAVIYTTPWDNHLVASGVWWYDHSLVSGVTLGWVPIEEYTFFVLQTLMGGLWMIFLSGRFKKQRISFAKSRKINSITLFIVGLVWAGAISALFLNWNQARYMALILVWALPPLALQLTFGGDILLKNYRLILCSILVPTSYLSGADALAIQAGTWTINPQFSSNILIGGVLPIEEFLFFLLTNTLVTFGMVLATSQDSRSRIFGLLQLRWDLPTLRREGQLRSSRD